MIRRALIVGAIGGLLLSIAGLYPVVSLLAPLIDHSWGRFLPTPLVHGILLMVSAGIAIPVMLTLGLFAVGKGDARGVKLGAKAGIIAGLIAGLLVYTTLISPINALFAYGTINTYLMEMHSSQTLPVSVLQQYVALFEKGNYLFEITMIVAALVSGCEGAFMGWRRRNEPVPERPSLYELVKTGQSPRRYFKGEESAAKAGLIVGLVGGAMAMVAAFSWFYVSFGAEWPELDAVLKHSNFGVVVTGPIRHAGSVLTPFVMLGLLIFGAVVVYLTKNPRYRFLSRFNGIMLASVLIFEAMFAILLRVFYFNAGLFPFWLMMQTFTQPAETADAASLFDGMMQLLQQPGMLIFGVLTIPWLFMFMGLITALVVGMLHFLAYGLTLPFILLRPVDKAAKWWRRMQPEPNEVLPVVYSLFNQEANAYAILPHLAVCTRRKMPPVSQLTAAYHTLGTSADEAVQAETIQATLTVLESQPDWRWSLDFQQVFSALAHILSAKTLDDILKLHGPMEQHTTSLPPLLIQSVQQIGRVVKELHKVEMVDDLGTKLIFLENGLAAINDAQRFVQKHLNDPETATSTPLSTSVTPEFTALETTLTHWQSIVLTAIKRLKGRADVTAELKSKLCPMGAEMPLVYCISNEGLNVAQKVHLKVLPGEGYRLREDSESWIDILPPGEKRQVQFSIQPQNGMRRLRVAWEVVYDDAVDAERTLEFADVIEFSEPDKPFQRIFPIPYVTGTPLKTDDVFVGREDVFAFIKENMLGTHQNNVIILHGQRRTGKTSVLYRLGQVMNESHFGVLIDMQGKPARGEADFLFSIADDIIFALEDHGIFIDPPSREDFEEQPEFFFRSRFLRSLRPHLAGKNLLLLFDEFEELQRRVEDGRLQPEIFQFLRNLMQHDERVDFVFSGTHKLEELGAEYWSILFNIAAYKPITFLSKDDMVRLIRNPIAEYNLEYDPLAEERIIKVTAGHPYFAQLVLHEMVVLHNESQRSYMTVMDVDNGLERIVERGEAHFKFIWSESSEEERLVLQAITELLVGADAVNVNDMRTFLADRGYDSEDNWAQALLDLEGRDILKRPSAKSPMYRFKVDLIRLWIDRTRPAL
ncbi:MAG: ATP-binding protein [Anaerolineae bacterium]|nr:ATP-binding protein [Anaerolineae bacterium]